MTLHMHGLLQGSAHTGREWSVLTTSRIKLGSVTRVLVVQIFNDFLIFCKLRRSRSDSIIIL